MGLNISGALNAEGLGGKGTLENAISLGAQQLATAGMGKDQLTVANPGKPDAAVGGVGQALDGVKGLEPAQAKNMKSTWVLLAQVGQLGQHCGVLGPHEGNQPPNTNHRRGF